MTVVLTARDLTRHYEVSRGLFKGHAVVRALNGVSFELEAGKTLAVVGELTSSVAHNLRNPLSSIRSSAELALESPGEDCSAEARDIIREVDRISDRVAELLAFSATLYPSWRASRVNPAEALRYE